MCIKPGLSTASKLAWNQHIDKITAKADSVLELVKRTCRDLKDIDTILYKIQRPEV